MMNDRRCLSRKLARDTVSFLLIGLAGSLGHMTTYDPRSSTVCLHWDATKVVVSLIGSAIGALMIGMIRYWMWGRSHPDAVRG
jgi:hypothetical protein